MAKRGFAPREWSAEELEEIKIAKEAGISRDTIGRGFGVGSRVVAKVEREHLAEPEDVKTLRARWRNELIGPMKERVLAAMRA